MGNILLIVALWLLAGSISNLVIVKFWWLKNHDFTNADLWFHVFLTIVAGPLCAIAALIIITDEHLSGKRRRVLIKKDDRP